MPTYLMLTTLTPQGVQTLKANPSRLREVNADVEELGAKVLHQWATLGEYDFVNIVEAPDDLTIAKVSIALGARGSAKLESLPLIPVDAFLAIWDAGKDHDAATMKLAAAMLAEDSDPDRTAPILSTCASTVPSADRFVPRPGAIAWLQPAEWTWAVAPRRIASSSRPFRQAIAAPTAAISA